MLDHGADIKENYLEWDVVRGLEPSWLGVSKTPDKLGNYQWSLVCPGIVAKLSAKYTTI